MSQINESGVVKYLQSLEPGKLPLKVFEAIARITVTPIIEIVPLRKNSKGGMEVLLTERERNDSNWPGMKHTPGTVIRANDEEGNFKNAFDRVLNGELGGIKIDDPVFVGPIFHRVKRGMEVAFVYYAQVTGESKNGEFYNVENLPLDIVDTQIGFIKMAVDSFRKSF